MSQDDRFEIRLSGSGGQGIILASIILAQAAAFVRKNHVCQSQSYGPEARGGKCKADVIISAKPIDYPKAIKLDLLLAMSQESCDAYFHDFKPTGLLVVDASLVEKLPTSRSVALPFTDIAKKLTGRTVAANMAALGALCRLFPTVRCKDLEKAVDTLSPGDSGPINLRVFKAGRKAMAAVDLDALPRSVRPDDEEEEEI